MTQNPYTPQDGQSSQQTPPTQQQFPTPATAPGEPMNVYPAANVNAANAQPIWPTVVGIISLCLAGFGGLMTLFGMIFQTFAQGLQTPQQREMMASMPDWHQTYQLVSQVIWLAMAILLAVGGVMLLKRRQLARTLHVAFAVIGVVLAIGFTVVGLISTSQMQVPGPADTIVKVTTIVTTIIGMFVSLAYPVFLLIWFARAKVKQHIQTWQS